MVGPGVGTLSTTDRLDVRAYPPPSPHHGYRFSPVRRRKSSSYRAPMRYPPPNRLTAHRCGTHGGVRVVGRTFDYRPAQRKSVPPPSPHHGYRFSPVRRRKSSSYRTRMRYPPPNRRTAPRCGIHGGVRVAGRAFDYGPARRKSVPSAVTPPWIPVFTGKTKEVVVVPHSDAVSTPQPSYRTPMRYPWWGKSGWAHLRLRTGST